MKMKQILVSFSGDETGAVTVDWVVLTAAVIGLGVAVSASVGSSAVDLAGDVESNLADTEIASYIPVTVGTVAFEMAFDPGPRECSGVPVLCSTAPQSGGTQVWYNMSDGTQWSKTTTNTTYYETTAIDSPTTSEITVVWKDQDGTVVDAPDAT